MKIFTLITLTLKRGLRYEFFNFYAQPCTARCKNNVKGFFTNTLREIKKITDMLGRSIVVQNLLLLQNTAFIRAKITTNHCLHRVYDWRTTPLSTDRFCSMENSLKPFCLLMLQSPFFKLKRFHWTTSFLYVYKKINQLSCWGPDQSWFLAQS